MVWGSDLGLGLGLGPGLGLGLSLGAGLGQDLGLGLGMGLGPCALSHMRCKAVQLAAGPKNTVNLFVRVASSHLWLHSHIATEVVNETFLFLFC